MEKSTFDSNRDGLIFDAMIEIAQALLFDRDCKLIIYLRDDKPEIPFPNHWDLFGGHVEAGETPEQALCRELEEEIGVELEIWRLFRRYECLTGDAYPNSKFIFCAEIDRCAADLTLYEGQRSDKHRGGGASSLHVCQYSRRRPRRFHRRRSMAATLWITFARKNLAQIIVEPVGL